MWTGFPPTSAGRGLKRCHSPALQGWTSSSLCSPGPEAGRGPNDRKPGPWWLPLSDTSPPERPRAQSGGSLSRILAFFTHRPNHRVPRRVPGHTQGVRRPSANTWSFHSTPAAWQGSLLGTRENGRDFPSTRQAAPGKKFQCAYRSHRRRVRGLLTALHCHPQTEKGWGWERGTHHSNDTERVSSSHVHLKDC